jgi:transposase-like protein
MTIVGSQRRSCKGASSTIPPFLKEIVERVLQELLEAEMTQHIGAAPTSEPRAETGSFFNRQAPLYSIT